MIYIYFNFIIIMTTSILKFLFYYNYLLLSIYKDKRTAFPPLIETSFCINNVIILFLLFLFLFY